jgi:antitoxin component YwqK of YwqJK toxin-antitoxin module
MLRVRNHIEKLQDKAITAVQKRLYNGGENKISDQDLENLTVYMKLYRLGHLAAANGTIGNVIRLYYSTGTPAVEYDIKEETARIFYQNGQVKAEGPCRLDTARANSVYQHDIWTEYHENGHVKAKGTYENYSSYSTKNERNGIWQLFDTNGVLSEEVTYKAGDKHGLAIRFHPNGTHMECVHYVQNEKHGPCQIYYPGGQVFAEKEYEYGKFKREVIYHPSGRQIDPSAAQYVWPLQIEEIGKRTVSMKNQYGRVIATGQVDDQGQAHGPWEFPDEAPDYKKWAYGWFENGDLVANAPSEDKLYKHKKVRQSILKQEGIKPALDTPNVQEITAQFRQDAQKAKDDVTHMMIAGGHTPIPGISRSNTSRTFSSAVVAETSPSHSQMVEEKPETPIVSIIEVVYT